MVELKGDRPIIDPGGADIGDDTHDLRPGGLFGICPGDPPTNGIVLCEKRARHALVDDQDRWRCGGVGGVECSSAEQARTGDVEILRGDSVVAGPRLQSLRRPLATFNDILSCSTQWQGVAKTGGFRPGQLREPFEQLTVKLEDLFAAGILAGW